MTQRMTPDDRKEQIIVAALKLAKKHGYASITREQIAEEAGISKALITRYFDFAELIDAVIARGIAERNVKLVSEALAHGNKAARRAVGRDNHLKSGVMGHLFP